MEKPNVFPTSSKMIDAMKEANETGSKIAEQFKEENKIGSSEKSEGELNALAKMNKETLDRLEEQLRLRDELMAKKRLEENGEVVEAINKEVSYSKAETTPNKNFELPDDKYEKLSTPQDDVPYDIIKLPSEGLLYKNCKSTLKVAYLNAMDENIITNPNLLRTGKFLEVLINRKLLNTDLRYKDLHVGDRNAIMVWLRSTGYGPMYKINLNDPNNDYKEFQVDIDLSKLPIKYLSVKPDSDGLFEYKLPISNKVIKFKLLTVGDIENIEQHIENVNKEMGSEFNDSSTYTLLKQIISVDGNFDSNVVKNFVEKQMRIGDVLNFREYINKIESGIDMNITVETPGGGSLETFLPLNTSFFWPKFGL